MKPKMGLVLAMVTVITVAVSAHDFWIEPSTFEPRAGEAVRLQLRVGERFAGEPVARNSDRIERFVAVGPSGERPVPGRDGMDPAGLLRLDEPGLWLVGYRSKPGPLQLSADAFERYLREEGLERIIDERAARGESKTPGRERFSRSVKALLRSGSTTTAAGYDRALGLTLEFVLDADPMSIDRVPVRLLHDGRPLAQALVVAYRKDAGAKDEGKETLRARTDAQGRVILDVNPGVWLIKAVHMQRADAGTGADWDSVWTALTFEVRAR